MQHGRERLKERGRLDGESLESDDMGPRDGNDIGQSAVPLDPEVEVIRTSVLQPERARGAAAASEVRVDAHRGTVLEHAGDLVAGDPGRVRPEGGHPAVGGAERPRNGPGPAPLLGPDPAR